MWMLFIILGAAAGAHIVIVNIADYPAPERLTAKLWVLLAAGGAGGALGGVLFGNMTTASDPMPAKAILGAAGVIATGLVVSAATAILAGLHLKPQAGR